MDGAHQIGPQDPLAEERDLSTRAPTAGVSGALGRKVRFLLFLSFFGLTACESIGPTTIVRDRFDYSSAVGQSWKSQMLLNIVKLRYGDAPVFLEVGQVVAGYSLQRSASATGNLLTFNQGPPPNAITGTIGIGGGVTYNDSPTITYSPLVGERFAQSLMGHIPPASILRMLQSGFPAEIVMRLGVQAINGLDNRRVQGALPESYQRPADPAFYLLLDKISQVQESGDLGMWMGPKGEVTLVFRSTREGGAGSSGQSRERSQAAIREIKRMLGLDATANEFKVVMSAVPHGNREIAMVTRSMLEVLRDMSFGIEAPEEDIREGQVSRPPAAPFAAPNEDARRLLRIKSSPERPSSAFVAIPYNGHWFWIDNRDRLSKNLFSFILLLFTFVEPVNEKISPVLSIPTSR